MGPRCSSAETQVCHRSYIIAALINWMFFVSFKFKRLRTVLEFFFVTNWRLNWSVVSPKLCLLSERSIRYIIMSSRTRNHWKKVIFSDEMKIEIGNNRKVYAWRKVDERLRPECNGLYQGRNYKTKFSVMLWGCISYYGVGTPFWSQTGG
jgi:hypothetical protein